MLNQFESDIKILDTTTKHQWYKTLNQSTPMFGTDNNFKIVIVLSCLVLILTAIYSIFCTYFVIKPSEELSNSIYVSELVTFANCLCLIGTSVVDLVGGFKCDVNPDKLRVSNFTTPFSTSTGKTLETCAAGQKTFFENLASLKGIHQMLQTEETFNKLLKVVDPWRITNPIRSYDASSLDNMENGIQYMNTLLKRKCLNKLQAEKMLEYRDSISELVKVYPIYEPYIANYIQIRNNGISVAPRVSYWFYATRLPLAEDEIDKVTSKAFAGDIPCSLIIDSFSTARHLICLPFETPFEVFWPYMIVAVVAGLISLIINKMIFKSLPEESLDKKIKDVESAIPPTSPPGKGEKPAPTVAPTPTAPGNGKNQAPTAEQTTLPAPITTSTPTGPAKGKNPAPVATPTPIKPGLSKNSTPNATPTPNTLSKGKKIVSKSTPIPTKLGIGKFSTPKPAPAPTKPKK